jgi:hypothetical protein
MGPMDINKLLLRYASKKDSEYLSKMQAALEKHDDFAALSIPVYLGESEWRELNLVNPYARRVFRKILLNEVGDLEQSSNIQRGVVTLLTFADADWTCGDRNYSFDFDAAKRKIRNALKGMDYIATIEIGIYPGISFDPRKKAQGCLVSFHAHAVVWASSRSKLERHKKTISDRFTPVHKQDTKTYPIINNLKVLKDVLKVLRYLTKMPSDGYQLKEGKAGHLQEHAPLNAGHLYRLFEFLKDYSIYDVWIAGGRGAEIMRDVRRDIRELLKR